jgi:hypothetical protein
MNLLLSLHRSHLAFTRSIDLEGGKTKTKRSKCDCRVKHRKSWALFPRTILFTRTLQSGGSTSSDLGATACCSIHRDKALAHVLATEVAAPTVLCRENLAYAAHLKLPRDQNMDRQRRSAIIDDALEMLQLK